MGNKTSTTEQGDFSNTLFSRHQYKKYAGTPLNHKICPYEFGIRVRGKILFLYDFILFFFSYLFLSLLARGNLLSIYDAYNVKKNNKQETIKEFNIKAYNETNNKKIIDKELEILSQFNHPCIPRINNIFYTDEMIYMAIEYLRPTRLNQLINLKNHETSFSVTDVRIISRLLVSALNYFHDNRFVLRDLSLANIVVRNLGRDAFGNSNNFDVKICDFVLACPIGTRDNLIEHPNFDWSLVPFTAPEGLVVDRDDFYYNTICDEAMDMWSLGVLIYTLLSGYLPFMHPDDRILLQSIKSASFHFQGAHWAAIPNEPKYFIGSLLHASKYDRMTAKEAAQSQWFKN